MSEFVSWYETLDGNVHFLTDADMPRAKECGVMDDVVGHHALYAVKGWTTDNKPMGEERECTDFSTPANFPPAIVAALKAGRVTYGDFPEGLLLSALYAERAAPLYAERDALYAKWEALDAKWKALDAKLWVLFAVPANRAAAWKE